MNRIIIATAAALTGVAPATAFAAPAPLPATDGAVTTPTTHVAAHHLHSTVHFSHGQRFDVPNRLLRNRNTLINGLPPQPQQFD